MCGQAESGVTIYCASQAVAEVVLTQLRGISYQGRTLEICEGRGFWSKFWHIYEQTLGTSNGFCCGGVIDCYS